ncbi:hypothetical protein KIN20_035499 [Parelaphostrongylus tenuis]|uniref:Uncharacterized protein n=1 Tax=Parelaphostrongylus tenuis TaxID=148309 RepID=A0AAD5RBW5_PARTN|nr:hypothetical protein KIN20_035499 [Parelaphostrongylus tenuis]
MSSSEDWITKSVGSLPLKCVAFDPTNELVAACAGSNCMLFSASDGKRTGVCEHTDDIVSVFFTEHYAVVTVTKGGEIVEWNLTESGPMRISSNKVTDFPVIRAFYLRADNRGILVIDHETHYSADCVMPNKSLAHIADLPSGLGYEQITIESSYIAYCSGKEVFVIPTDDNSSMMSSSYLCKAHIEGIGERNSANVFVRITSQGDTLAATLAIGRVYIWSHVSQKGVHDSAFTIHWHKVAPCIVLSQFGGLLSAGAEAVLCKFSLSGTGRPSMLPRLAAPVRDLFISTDASHLAVVLEDNSLHVVLTSSMTVLSSLQTVVTCGRSLTSVFTTDPCMPGTVVMNGKPGSLQWIQCTDSFTLSQVSFTLENVADGDMSFSGIIQTFPDVEQVFISRSVVVTLERMINFEEDHKRLRFWKRASDDCLTVHLVDSFVVSTDTVAVSGCRDSHNEQQELFISVRTNGRVNMWIPCEEKTRFKLDPVRQIDRRYTFHCGSTIHNGMWAAAYTGGANNTDVIVVWEMAEMNEVEVLRTDGRARSIEFDGKGHLVCATDRAVRCWRHLAIRFDLLWIVEQSLGIHVSPSGTFAWDEDTVVEFDVETAALKGSFKLMAPVTDLVATIDKESRLLVVARTEKGLLLAYPKSQPKISAETLTRSTKTPFALLAPIETTVQSAASTMATSGVVAANKAAAMRLFDGPSHALPPVSHLAPLFIAHCLAPPRQE